MNLRNTIAILGLVALHGYAGNHHLHVAALAQIESGGRDSKIGANGERSKYQIMKSVWDDWQKADEHLPFIRCKGKLATQCAMYHSILLRDRFFDKKGIFPSSAQFYCMWNMGFEGFAAKNFLVSACPRRVQERAERFANLVAALKEEGK